MTARSHDGILLKMCHCYGNYTSWRVDPILLSGILLKIIKLTYMPTKHTFLLSDWQNGYLTLKMPIGTM